MAGGSPLPNVPGGHHLTHGVHLAGPHNKKQRGVKSTLGRIFGTGKKDKMKVIKGDTGGFMSPGQHSLGGNPFVTPPLTRYGFFLPSAGAFSFNDLVCKPHKRYCWNTEQIFDNFL